MPNKTNWTMLINLVLLCELAGAIGSVFSAPAIPNWYARLAKPEFSPPNWIFAPVWVGLYALMGIAAYLIWEKGMKKRLVAEAMIFFALQLALNVAWSYLFFGLRSPFLGLLCIILLWALIAATAFKFYDLKKEAGYLFLPYVAWVSFAGVLNFAIWALNP